MTALGRFRALGAIGNTFYAVSLLDGMEPQAWAASNPALQLNMSLVPMPQQFYDDRKSQGLAPAFMFTCAADPVTVQQILMQDPRVLEAVLVGGDSVDVVAVGDDVTYVREDRPAPGTPEYSLPGYIPKLPNDATKTLSVQDQAAAAYDPASNAFPPAAAAPCPKIPWWLMALGVVVLSRR